MRYSQCMALNAGGKMKIAWVHGNFTVADLEDKAARRGQIKQEIRHNVTTPC